MKLRFVDCNALTEMQKKSALPRSVWESRTAIDLEMKQKNLKLGQFKELAEAGDEDPEFPGYRPSNAKQLNMLKKCILFDA